MRQLLIPLVGSVLLISACTDTAPTSPSQSSSPKPANSNTSDRSSNEGAKTANDRQRNTGSDIPNGTISNRPLAEKADSQRTQGNRDKLEATGAPNANGVSGSVMSTTPAHRGDAATRVNDTSASTLNGSTEPTINGGNAEAAITPQRDAESQREAANSTNDNSRRNLAEDGSKPTPLDQGDNEIDRSITQSIRASVVDRSDMSMNAKNSKIITRDGVVTLRGPVADARERDAIGATASAQPGVKRVDNQLEPAQP